MSEIPTHMLEYLRYRYHALIELEYNVVEDINTASFLSLDDVVTRLNEQEEKIKQLEKELSELKKDPFKFNFTQHHNKINANKLNLKDKHTEIKMNGERIHITVTPPNHDPFIFHYMITGVVFDRIYDYKSKRDYETLTNLLHSDLTHKPVEKSCSNCTHHTYDWFDDGDEFEVCLKNQDLDEGPCDHYEEI